VLGSDGFWDYVTPDIVQEELKYSSSIGISVKNLVKLAIKQSSFDNISLMIV
jgi:serine/threonine protein phosphatase PrpC